ncbi:hypothetical protein PPERSA_02484 [Pseudocohnilembus persalinus]|uniref:RING-type domain-containing protein n=1 Tax=Pseudocohnilembus persalinus TaxID=266149 RepID=A0A0V0QAV4_PSEPJ|nr:hypothetical protein PPERSA_02484 [Pseudocohnilembus persalinus]|eukprot:KRW99372.1 hypothetical protein PPERSA_02484 [Pseudocohnilembus persalinus]
MEQFNENSFSQNQVDQKSQIMLDSYQNNKKPSENENNFYLKSGGELNHNEQDEIDEFTDNQGDIKMAQNLKYNSNSQNLEFSKSEDKKQALVAMSIFYLATGYSIIGLFTIFGLIFGIYYCCKRPTHFHSRGEQLNNGIQDLNDLKIQECYICIVEYTENDKIINFECGHTFHLDCIKDWLKKNATCPSCRNDLKQQLKNIEKKKKSEISNDKDQIVLNVQP